MNLTDHDNAPMPEPTKAQQAEYYRLYAEIEKEWDAKPQAHFCPVSRLIHAEVARRMNIKEES